MRVLEATAYQHLFLWNKDKEWGDFHKIMGIQIDNEHSSYYSYLMEGSAQVLNECISEKLNRYQSNTANNL